MSSNVVQPLTTLLKGSQLPDGNEPAAEHAGQRYAAEMEVTMESGSTTIEVEEEETPRALRTIMEAEEEVTPRALRIATGREEEDTLRALRNVMQCS